jgi:hypothetical protein
MRTANWHQCEATSVEAISPTEIEAVLATVEGAEGENDFDLGEPWDVAFEPTDDDPE